MNWSMYEYITSQVHLKIVRAFGQDNKIYVQKMYPRALQNVGNYNGNVAWVITAITSPQWMLERCIRRAEKRAGES